MAVLEMAVKIFGTVMFTAGAGAFFWMAVKQQADMWRKVLLGTAALSISGVGIASIWVF